jgi:outer membrane murein-binding lipoprotein Lpp
VKNMSIDKIQEQIDELLDKRDALEEKCDTLPQCQEDDGCATCATYKKIDEIDQKVEELEAKIDELMGEEEDIEDE